MTTSSTQANSASCNYDQTVADFVAGSFAISTDHLRDFLIWPPDAFAMTSLLLARTGAYRHILSPHLTLGKPDEQNNHLTSWSDLLNNALSSDPDVTPTGSGEGTSADATSFPNFLAKMTKWLTACTLSDIRGVDILPDDSNNSSDQAILLITALLNLHALSDQISQGLGLHVGDSQDTSFRYFANVMLVTTGSLSRLPKTCGVVLPKIRTPQVGITIRSLSLNLSFHQTEADITWRSIPWINSSNNIINILVVPHPSDVHALWFGPTGGSPKSDEDPSYFTYSPREHKLDINWIIDLYDRSLQEVHRVHVIVLPEASVDDHELGSLKAALHKHVLESPVGHHDPQQQHSYLPILITGVRSNRENSVRLSSFFSGKWYEISQHKHHRWKLDRQQLSQYSLSGFLSDGDTWWEAIDIHKRAVTFFVPNSWFVICPLICEDLARQEPISGLLRGVGPSLIAALLLDGPQMKERWPARYASILADDPGSSVLTATSLGMARKSRRSGQDVVQTVASWRDPGAGWSEYRVDDDTAGVLLTLSVTAISELTADKRSNDPGHATMTMSGWHIISAPRSNNNSVLPVLDPRVKASDADTAELSVLTYLCDAMFCPPDKQASLDSEHRFDFGPFIEFAKYAMGRASTTETKCGLLSSLRAAIRANRSAAPAEDTSFRQHEEFGAVLAYIHVFAKESASCDLRRLLTSSEYPGHNEGELTWLDKPVVFAINQLHILMRRMYSHTQAREEDYLKVGPEGAIDPDNRLKILCCRAVLWRAHCYLWQLMHSARDHETAKMKTGECIRRMKFIESELARPHSGPLMGIPVSPWWPQR